MWVYATSPCRVVVEENGVGDGVNGTLKTWAAITLGITEPVVVVVAEDDLNDGDGCAWPARLFSSSISSILFARDIDGLVCIGISVVLWVRRCYHVRDLD